VGLDGSDGITANTFAEQYADAKTDEPLNVYISSPGGVVRDGLTIYSMLAAHPSEVHVHAYGVVGSIATIVACAADRMSMAQNAKYMIHNPMGPSAMAWGDADDLREAAAETEKMAEILDGLKDSMADIYAARTGGDKLQILDWMAAETWFSAAEAQRAGFADAVIPNKAVAASVSSEPFAAAVESVEELEQLQQLVAGITPKQRPERSAALLAKAQAKMGLTMRVD
jgi:ATP-dependent protease ClpP protease subunit